LVLQKNATVQIGLSERWFRKRRRAMLIGWGLAFLAIGMIIGGLACVDRMEEVGVPLLILSPFALLVGLIWGIFGSRMVYANRITDEYVWLRGCHRDFLARFPQWPYVGY